jgi:cellulose synthase/poly-beta-1,6-N-acetylglucosamine synthase-like glycosyltransferase
LTWAVAAAAALAAIAVALLLWSYVGYPVVLARLARKARLPVPAPDAHFPSVEVLVAAFDEEPAIAGRVENVLAQEYPGSLSLNVGCDGCRDATVARARAAAAADPRVRVTEFETRRGKASVINDLVRDSRAEVLVFTDANSEFQPEAVARLVERFADPAVGAVCGRLELLPASGSDPTPETEFWDRESGLKEAEGRLGVCLGANGAIYAARRALVSPLPEGAVLDDFRMAAQIARGGRRVEFAGDAIAREVVPPDVAVEAARRFRIGIGAGEVLRTEPWLWNFRRRPLLTFAFVSRKAARWLAPLAAIGALGCGLAVPSLRPWAAAALFALGLLAVSVRLRLRPSGWAGRLYYFGVINLAIAAGVIVGLVGYRRPAWKRTPR